ncbi:hypothetical protein AALB16_06300 [Lachnospiraceae bacterium 62-35]
MSTMQTRFHYLSSFWDFFDNGRPALKAAFVLNIIKNCVTGRWEWKLLLVFDFIGKDPVNVKH